MRWSRAETSCGPGSRLLSSSPQALDPLLWRGVANLVVAPHRGSVRLRPSFLGGMPEVDERKVTERVRPAPGKRTLPEFKVLASPPDEFLVEAADVEVGL